MIDDYAHHPTEIRTTLEGLRAAIGEKRRLIAVYQPHRYTRTRDCLGQFNNVFAPSDQIIITEIYPAGESPIEGIDDETVFNDIQKTNRSAVRVQKKDLIPLLAQKLQPGDLLVTLGAGDITHIGKMLLEHYG